MRVILYGRPDCHLCDELKAELATCGRKVGFVLEERNIEEDDALMDRYRYLVPVLEIEGGGLFFPPHDSRELCNMFGRFRRTTEKQGETGATAAR
jgi:hypothetical protein